MCDHNSNIAKKLGKQNVAMLWSFVKLMYSSTPKHQQNNDTGGRSMSATQNMLSGHRLMNSSSLTAGWSDEQSDVKSIINLDGNTDEYQSNDLTAPKHGEFKPSTGAGVTSTPAQVSRANTIESSSDALTNTVHGDAELTVDHMDYIKSFRNGFLYIGPHDLSKNFSLPNSSIMNHDMHQTSRDQIVSEERRNISPVLLPQFSTIEFLFINFPIILQQPLETQISVLKILPHTSSAQWDSAKMLADALQLLADIDDIQSAVCILIALGDRRKDIPIDDYIHVNIYL